MSTNASDQQAFDQQAIDQQDIRTLLSAWAHAIESKDFDGIVAHYTADTVLFDAIPPYQTIGAAAILQAWANCLPYMPAQFTVELRDVVVQVSGDAAWAHFLLHFNPTPADDPCGQTWTRVTTAYLRSNGAWKTLHEHNSLPFNPMTNQVWFIKDPAVAEVPDYGQAP
jgi:ketosteroid isomerase-like protein